MGAITVNTTRERRLLAAIVFEHGAPPDTTLECVARQLQSEGRSVAGYLQREVQTTAECCGSMLLEHLGDGYRHVISQQLGRDTKGCRLDPRAMAALCGALLADLDRKPDLLILNRFGKGESEGHGFRAVFDKAIEKEIPVLSAVREPYLPAWRDFTAEYAAELTDDVDCVTAWCRAALHW